MNWGNWSSVKIIPPFGAAGSSIIPAGSSLGLQTNFGAFFSLDNTLSDSTGAVTDLSLTFYTPRIDLRTAGQRTITPNSVVKFGADSGLTIPDPNGWLPSFFGNYAASADISAEYAANSSVGPVFTTTIITRQFTGPLNTATITSQGGIFAIQNQSNMVIRGGTR